MNESRLDMLDNWAKTSKGEFVSTSHIALQFVELRTLVVAARERDVLREAMDEIATLAIGAARSSVDRDWRADLADIENTATNALATIDRAIAAEEAGS